MARASPSTPSASGIRRRLPAWRSARRSAGQIEIDDEDDLGNEIRIQEGVLPSALAPVLPVMFLPNGRLLGALQSLVSGVYKGPFAHLQTFFAVVSRQRVGALLAGG